MKKIAWFPPFKNVGDDTIYDGQSGQPMPPDYEGEVIVYGPQNDVGGSLFQTWIENGERNWKYLRPAGEAWEEHGKTAKFIWEEEFDPGARILVSSPSGDFQATVDAQNPDGSLHVTNDSGVGQDVNIVDVVRKVADLYDGKTWQQTMQGEFGRNDAGQALYKAMRVWGQMPQTRETWDIEVKPLVEQAAGLMPDMRDQFQTAMTDIEKSLDMAGDPDAVFHRLDLLIRSVNGVLASRKLAAWQDWQSAQGVEVVTKQGADIFDSLEEAQKVYPTLDPEKNTKDFTWAMAGQDGRMRFESWEMYEMLSSSKKAGRADDKDVAEEDVEPKQLDMGREVEKEHHDDCPSVDNEALATEISLDHLSELPDYYDRLKQMEEEGKSTLGEREDLPTKTRWCELCQNPAGEFDDIAWEKRLHLCDMCLHEGFGEKKIWDLAASRQKKSDLVPPEITEIIELFRQTGVEDFQTWEGIAPGEWKITWQDDETKLPYLLTVSPNGWTFVAEGVHVQRQGFDYPPSWKDLQSVWGEARDAWEALHGDEYQPIPGAAPYMGRSTVDPGSMLAGGEAEPGRYGVMSGLGSIVPPIKMADFDDETVSPLHRFYQERNIPGDPQRLALEAAVSRVHEVLGKFNKFLRLMGIQFERIEAIRYAGTDKHIDRGRVWLKAQVVAGAPIARRATLSVVVTIKDGEVCDAAEFIDASQKHRLLNEASLKAYLNLQETPAIMRGPNVERAQIDRTILPPTPAKSLFHGRGGVDA